MREDDGMLSGYCSRHGDFIGDCEPCAEERIQNYRLVRDDELARLRDQKQRTIKAFYDIEQTLGKALGYPWYKDDQKNFPGATEAEGVCVGEHVPESLAAEAANRIARLRAENRRLREFARKVAVMYRICDEHLALTEEADALLASLSDREEGRG